MVKLNGPNGTYFVATKEELIWFSTKGKEWFEKNEKHLPQMEGETDVFLLSPEDMAKLFQ